MPIRPPSSCVPAAGVLAVLAFALGPAVAAAQDQGVAEDRTFLAGYRLLARHVFDRVKLTDWAGNELGETEGPPRGAAAVDAEAEKFARAALEKLRLRIDGKSEMRALARELEGVVAPYFAVPMTADLAPIRNDLALAEVFEVLARKLTIEAIEGLAQMGLNKLVLDEDPSGGDWAKFFGESITAAGLRAYAEHLRATARRGLIETRVARTTAKPMTARPLVLHRAAGTVHVLAPAVGDDVSLRVRRAGASGGMPDREWLVHLGAKPEGVDCLAVAWSPLEAFDAIGEVRMELFWGGQRWVWTQGYNTSGGVTLPPSDRADVVGIADLLDVRPVLEIEGAQDALQTGGVQFAVRQLTEASDRWRIYGYRGYETEPVDPLPVAELKYLPRERRLAFAWSRHASEDHQEIYAQYAEKVVNLALRLRDPSSGQSAYLVLRPIVRMTPVVFRLDGTCEGPRLAFEPALAAPSGRSGLMLELLDSPQGLFGLKTEWDRDLELRRTVRIRFPELRGALIFQAVFSDKELSVTPQTEFAPIDRPIEAASLRPLSSQLEERQAVFRDAQATYARVASALQNVIREINRYKSMKPAPAGSLAAANRRFVTISDQLKHAKSLLTTAESELIKSQCARGWMVVLGRAPAGGYVWRPRVQVTCGPLLLASSETLMPVRQWR